MPVLAAIRERFEREQPLAGHRVSACLHVTTETANLAHPERWWGGRGPVRLNPLSTQDDVAAHSSRSTASGLRSRARTTTRTATSRPRSITVRTSMDDSADVIGVLLGRREQLGDVIAGTEETTTGVIRLKALSATASSASGDRGERGAHNPLRQPLRHRPVDDRQDHQTTNVLLAGKRFVSPATAGQARRRDAGAWYGVISSSPRSIRSALRRRWTATRSCRWRSRRPSATSSAATGDKNVIIRAHGANEGRCDPRQHRPLQRRDRDRRAPRPRGRDARLVLSSTVPLADGRRRLYLIGEGAS